LTSAKVLWALSTEVLLALTSAKVLWPLSTEVLLALTSAKVLWQLLLWSLKRVEGWGPAV
jgi:hypothetical protein